MAKSNLGFYQDIVTWSKKVGGPLQLLVIVGVAGYGILRTGEAGIKAVHKYITNKNKKQAMEIIYKVNSNATTKTGIEFKIGDEYKILGLDGDVAVIEIIGDENNPYVVSAQVLSLISDFTTE